MAKEDVLQVFHRQQRPLRLDDLLRLLDVSRRDKRALLSLLEDLASQGELIRLHGGKWLDSRQARTVRGTLAVLKNGAGFVTPEQGATQASKQGHRPASHTDIFIRPEELAGAWNNDVVDVALYPGSGTEHTGGRNPEGRILRVVERKQTELTLFVTRQTTPRGVIGRPSDTRFDFVVDVDLGSLTERPEPGTLLKVRMDAPSGHGGWLGTALALIGRENDAAVQERLVKINHRIPMEFPEGVEQEASGLLAGRHLDGGPVPDGRTDLRHIDFVTIDGSDARDFDDAVHAERTDDGWLLHVAIADVSWYVRPGSGLDREARERGNSCYFPLSVEPMLPEALSNDLCSLRPEEDRFVLAAKLSISSRGAVTNAEFMTGVIRSRARLTYETVQAALDGAATDMFPALLPMVRELAGLAEILRAVRMRRGALDMDIPEPAYDVDGKGRVLAIRKAKTLFSHKLIEECMLAANEAVARFLVSKDLPFPCRIHPDPDPERLETLFTTLHSASLPAEMLALIPAKPTPAAIKPLLDAARDTPQAFVVNRMVLRAMMQARYEPEVSGHFGLASEAYCHFTSPIRRYADLVTHRAVRLAVGHPVGLVPARHKLLAITDLCNTRERAAQDAERETARRMACLLLEDRTGEVFEGVISGVMDFGIFVELADMPVEGMVRVATLDDDWYAYDPDRAELVGAGTGRSFRLGQPVTVRLERTDLGRLEIDLTLLKGGNSSPEGRRGARAAFSSPRPRKPRETTGNGGHKGRHSGKKASAKRTSAGGAGKRTSHRPKP